MAKPHWLGALFLILGTAGPKALAATLSGMVVDAADHRPIAGAYVIVHDGRVDGGIKENRLTGADGRFVFKDLPSIPLCVWGEKQTNFGNALEQKILLSPGETRNLEFALGKQITLHVLVVNRQTGGLLAKSHIGMTQSQKDQDIQVTSGNGSRQTMIISIVSKSSRV